MHIELSQLVAFLFLNVLLTIYAYSRGHRDGTREGYMRGRSISFRAVADQNK